MKKIVVGNWKMHGDAAMARTLAEAVAARCAQSPKVQTVLCPPATLISKVVEWLIGSDVHTGGQDCARQAQGAHTGDIGAAMLADAGATYVIVGHSERRTQHKETSNDVREKAVQAMKSALVPIICIGETEAERDAGKAEAVVGQQIKDSIPDDAKNNRFILAYEPVWAIGTGKTPTADDIRSMHAYIASVAAQRTGLAPEAISVLYGGSVKADNASSIMAIAGVAGVLVGGASLKADEFSKIISAAAG